MSNLTDKGNSADGNRPHTMDEPLRASEISTRTQITGPEEVEVEFTETFGSDFSPKVTKFYLTPRWAEILSGHLAIDVQEIKMDRARELRRTWDGKGEPPPMPYDEDAFDNSGAGDEEAEKEYNGSLTLGGER